MNGFWEKLSGNALGYVISFVVGAGSMFLVATANSYGLKNLEATVDLRFAQLQGAINVGILPEAAKRLAEIAVTDKQTQARLVLLEAFLREGRRFTKSDSNKITDKLDGYGQAITKLLVSAENIRIRLDALDAWMRERRQIGHIARREGE